MPRTMVLGRALVALVLCLSVVWDGTLAVALPKSSQYQDPATRPPKAKAKDRTTPLVNKMSVEQKERARVHKARMRASDTRLVDEGLILYIVQDTMVSPLPRPASRIVRDLTCQADGVFLGRVVSATVLPTEDGALLFTDYVVETTEVFRAPKRARQTRGGTVVVTQPGGTLDLGDIKPRVEVSSFPPLELNQEYLFFLEYLPSTAGRGAYYPANPVGVFTVIGERLASRRPMPTTDDSLYSGIEKARVLEWVRGASCK